MKHVKLLSKHDLIDLAPENVDWKPTDDGNRFWNVWTFAKKLRVDHTLNTQLSVANKQHLKGPFMGALQVFVSYDTQLCHWQYDQFTSNLGPCYWRLEWGHFLKPPQPPPDWKRLLKKVCSVLTSRTSCIFVPGGVGSTWRCPRHKRDAVPLHSSLHLLLEECQVERLCWVGSPCRGKSVSSPTPIVFGRLLYEVMWGSERESMWESTTSLLKFNLYFPECLWEEIWAKWYFSISDMFVKKH